MKGPAAKLIPGDHESENDVLVRILQGPREFIGDIYAGTK